MKRRVVIHTADWHLGKNRKYSDYLEQQRLMLTAILSIVIETLNQHQDDDVWLIVAGDIFDRNEDTDREEFILPILTILYPLIELKKQHRNFNFWFIDGNHDRQPYDPTDANALVSVVSPMVRMAEDHFAVNAPKWIKEHELLLVPFGQHTVTSLLELLKKYPSKFLVMHECCAGITTDIGWKPPRDQDHYIDAGALLAGEPSLVAVFLGDIHRYQKLDAQGICWYAGSPITLDHGHKMPKGVLIHRFKDEDGWKREGEPELRSLLPYSPELKFHTQLGVISDPSRIPIDTLANYKNQYLQFSVSAEVYAVVSRQLPELFESQQTSWDHIVDEETTKVVKVEEIDDQSQIAYYQPLIEQWILDNGKELTKAERDECVVRILKDFESRV